MRLAGPALLIVSLLWALALVATPYVVSHSQEKELARGAARAVYLLGHVICHQRPERSYHLWHTQFPVCARCEGIYLAAPAGIALLLGARRRWAVSVASRSTWRRIIVLAAIPTILTLVWEWTTGDMTPAVTRMLAGAALGSTIAATVAAVAVGELR